MCQNNRELTAIWNSIVGACLRAWWRCSVGVWVGSRRGRSVHTLPRVTPTPCLRSVQVANGVSSPQLKRSIISYPLVIFSFSKFSGKREQWSPYCRGIMARSLSSYRSCGQSYSDSRDCGQAWRDPANKRTSPLYWLKPATQTPPDWINR